MSKGIVVINVGSTSIKDLPLTAMAAPRPWNCSAAAAS